MACGLIGAKPLYETMLEYSKLKNFFSEILSEIDTFSFKEVYLKMASVKWPQFYQSLNVLMLTQSLISSV